MKMMHGQEQKEGVAVVSFSFQFDGLPPLFAAASPFTNREQPLTLYKHQPLQHSSQQSQSIHQQTATTRTRFTAHHAILQAAVSTLGRCAITASSQDQLCPASACTQSPPLVAMDYLSYWLMLVAAMRTLSVVLGYRSPRYFQEQMFTTSSAQVTPLASRTFAIWTLLSCTLTILAALHLHERGIYLATTASFYIAALYFTLELLVFGTVKLKDRFIVVTFVIASQLQCSTPHG